MELVYDTNKIYLFKNNNEFESKKIDENEFIDLHKGEITDKLSQILDKISRDENLKIENPRLSETLKSETEIEVSQEFPLDSGKNIRKNLSKQDSLNDLFYINLKILKEGIQKESSERDKMLINAAEMVNDLDEALNLYTERLKEWYSLHFPELGEAVEDNETYVNLICELGERDNFTQEKILDASDLHEKKAKWISDKRNDSVGAEVGKNDLEMILIMANRVNDLRKTREKMVDYVEEVMSDLAPNLKELAGAKIGAGLISLSGGLESLAMSPSSTVQVLGAEQALFKHLRSGTSPPKHGIIYKHPMIQKNSHKIRGRISRALAGKITIAARIDHYSGEYKAEPIKQELEERVKEIKEEEGMV